VVHLLEDRITQSTGATLDRGAQQLDSEDTGHMASLRSVEYGGTDKVLTETSTAGAPGGYGINIREITYTRDRVITQRTIIN
jgi:hypothetical protein